MGWVGGGTERGRPVYYIVYKHVFHACTTSDGALIRCDIFADLRLFLLLTDHSPALLSFHTVCALYIC
jgi:hypothetical protein